MASPTATVEDARTERSPGGGAPLSLLEAIGDAVIAIDEASRVTYWGPGAERLYGVPASAAVGRPLAESHAYEWDTPDDERRAWSALERDGSWRGRSVHVLRSGARLRVDATVTVLRDERGRRSGLLAVIRDETARWEADEARRRAEAELAAGEARYRELFEGLLETIFIYEPVLDERGELADVVLRDANDAALAQVGRPLEELRGRTATELFGAEAVRPFLATLARVSRTGLSDRWESAFDWNSRQYVASAHRSAGGLLVAAGLDVTDRRRAEEALRESEERFRAAFAHAAIGFAMKSPDGRVLEVNGAYCELTGYPADELRGLTVDRLIHAGDLPGYRALLDRALAGELRDFVVENRYARKDGSELWVRKSVSLVRDAAGAPRWFIALVEDVSDRRAVEARLRESEERALRRAAELEAVLDTVPAAVWIARDARGDRIEANRVGAELLRAPPGSNLSVTAPGIDRPRHFTVQRDGRVLGEDELPVQRAARTGEEIKQAETDVVFEDGEVRQFLGNAAPIRDAEGRVTGSVGAFIDVTARKRAERSVQESEARLRAFVDSDVIGILFGDVEGRVYDCNREFARIVGRTREDVLAGKVDWKVITPAEDRPLDAVALGEARETGRCRPYEKRYARPDGTLVPVQVGYTLLEPDRTRSVAFILDITERKAAELAVREADRRKTEFLAFLSHELRNPLGPIKNSIVLMERAGADGSIARRAREVLQRQTRQLERLVDDLLDVSRIAHGKITVRPERLDLRELLRRAWADAKALFEQRDVELLVSEPDEPVWVDADGARFAQLLGNLLNNALKFTPPRGRVELRLARRADVAELTVQDDGVGLDATELQRIFDPFVQSERTRAGHGGLGIGLALVKEIAARHGGDVRASSRGVGAGAEFTVRVPLAACGPEDRDSRSRRPSAGPGLAVLLVEDDADAAATLSDLLFLGGHRVQVAATGAAGIAAASAGAFDVLLCDVGLPDMSGHDVVRVLRASPPGARLYSIALTGYAQPRDRDAALAAGFDAHLPKPPPLEALDELLSEVAQRRWRREGGRA
jgi:PAS domain S-box-containing protein